jgi:hypothetical protein
LATGAASDDDRQPGGTDLRQMSVALPKARGGKKRVPPPEASMVALFTSGQVAAGIASPWPDVPTGAYLSKGAHKGKHFVRSSSQKLRLIGIDGSDFVFLKLGEPGSGLFEVAWETFSAAG